jgi:hypothetical protein
MGRRCELNQSGYRPRDCTPEGGCHRGVGPRLQPSKHNTIFPEQWTLIAMELSVARATMGE